MNNIIAKELKTYIDTLEWSDKTAGLVQTVSIGVKNAEGATIEKRYPVSCEVDYNACIKGAYQHLTPDSKKKSVIYFEDKGITGIQREKNRLKMQSNLRLVCWLNLNKIGDVPGVSGNYVIDVIKCLPQIPFSTDNFISVFIRNFSQVERSVNIFSKYTYNETAIQYLLYPYDFFALDLTIDLTIPCLTS